MVDPTAGSHQSTNALLSECHWPPHNTRGGGSEPPKGLEEVLDQMSRWLHAHEGVLEEARTMARLAAEHGDDGTNDGLVSSAIRTNALQVWFVAEHVVDTPEVQAD